MARESFKFQIWYSVPDSLSRKSCIMFKRNWNCFQGLASRSSDSSFWLSADFTLYSERLHVHNRGKWILIIALNWLLQLFLSCLSTVCSTLLKRDFRFSTQGLAYLGWEHVVAQWDLYLNPVLLSLYIFLLEHKGKRITVRCILSKSLLCFHLVENILSNEMLQSF